MAASRPVLIRNGCVLTLDRRIGDFSRADVLVRHGKIAAVGPGLETADAEIIDASDCIVMPGFVDTHRHMWQGRLRNLLPDAPLAKYFRIVSRTFGPVFTPEDVYAATLTSALGAIDCGITNILDWSSIQNTPAHTEAAIAALSDAGIRAVFAFGNPASATGQFWGDPRHRYPADLPRLRKEHFSSADQLTTLALASVGGPHERLVEVWQAAREVEAPISIHAGTHADGALERLGEAGLMKPDTTYIHCCHLTDREWAYIRDTGGALSISPYVELTMGIGTPPVQKALDLGIRPSLSIDVETSAPGDMFTQMRCVLALQRPDARASGGQILTARDVLEFATVEGAAANRLGSRIGTLTPGKEADIILLRTDRFDVLPMNDPVGAVVTSMSPASVDTVIIAGKIRKRHGQLVGVDLSRVARLADEARDRVVAAISSRCSSPVS